MNDLMLGERGVPPGLWLPTPEESTEQYLTGNLKSDPEPEDYVDYGTFAVAMTCFAVQESNVRVNTMPTGPDLQCLYDEGYGYSLTRIGREYGVGNLQLALGYYPKGLKPTKEAVEERLGWVYEVAFERDTGETIKDAGLSFDQVVRWASARGYLPGFNLTYSLFDGDSFDVRTKLGLHTPPYRADRSRIGLYRLGARIIAENDGPVSHSEFRQRYNGEYESSADVAIVSIFGTHTKFWREFGYLPTTSGLDADDLLEMGVIHAVRNGGKILNGDDMTRLSAEKRFASAYPIKQKFNGIGNYRALVRDAYEIHQKHRHYLVDGGVNPDVIDAIAHNHVFDEVTASRLRQIESALRELGQQKDKVRMVVAIFRDGLNLLEDDIFEMQLQELEKAFKLARMTDAQRHEIFELIPRIDPDEAMRMIGRQVGPK